MNQWSSSPTSSTLKEIHTLCTTQAVNTHQKISSTLTHLNTINSNATSPAPNHNSKQIQQSPLTHLGTPILTLLQRYCNSIINRTGNYKLLLQRLDDLKSIANEKLYAFPFRDVPVEWRWLFMEVSCLRGCCLVLRDVWEGMARECSGRMGESEREDEGGEGDWVDDVVRALDMAVIMVGYPSINATFSPGSENEDEDEEEEENTTKQFIQKTMELLGRLIEVEEEEKKEKTQQTNLNTQPPQKRRKLTTAASWIQNDTFPPPTTNHATPPIKHALAKITSPTLHQFQHYMDNPTSPENLGPEPLIITDSLQDWPALTTRPWNSPSYLLNKTIGGRRLVPVEIGRSYVDEGWGQSIIPFKSFLETYILSSPSPTTISTSNLPNPNPNPQIQSSTDKNRAKETEEKATAEEIKIAYLAQHNLFTQIPSLRNDILTPDYCYTTPPPPHPTSPQATIHAGIPTLESPLLNAWFGQAGTISPLHTDPYHNILCQVVGQKYVRLYAPRESERLYPRGVEEGGVDMGNTSSIDLDLFLGDGGDGEGGGAGKGGEDGRLMRERFPLFEDAKYVEGILGPGDCLYIPVGWWHYIRSLEVSFSVSFWFN